ncbi:MAG: shikimate kinase [Thermoplasmatota archaeon]
MSVVNALAIGKGASLAIDLAVEATVVLRDDRREIRVQIEPEADEDPRLAEETVRRVFDRLGHLEAGADVLTRSDAPASMGLKTSSAAANAIAAAANAACQRYDGEALPSKDLLPVAIDAALAAKVTITGAYDDASASARGGLCVTDNGARQLLARHELEPMAVLLWLPKAKVRKVDAGRHDLRSIAAAMRLAHEAAVRGAWIDAMTVNGLAYGSTYGVDFEVYRRAVAAGALAVSVSGTGPAIAAVAKPDAAAAVERAWTALSQGSIPIRQTQTSNAAMEVLP